MREKQPRLLVIWGKYEASFDSRSRNRTGVICPIPKSTSSMVVISRWIRRLMILRL